MSYRIHEATFLNYIYQSCLQDNQNFKVESKCNQIARVSLKCVTVGLAFCGAYPNIALSLKLGGDNKFFGILMATSNFIGRSALVTWSYHKIIDAELGPLVPLSRKLEKQTSVCAKVSSKGTMIIFGVFSQTPRAYLAFVYNNKELLPPIFILVSLSALPMYSLELSFQAISKKIRNRKMIEKELLLAKSELISNINQYRQRLKIAPNVSSLIQPQNYKTNEQAAVIFLRTIITNRVLPPLETTCQKVCRIGSSLIGYTAGIGLTVAQSYYTYTIATAGSREFFGDNWGQYIIGSALVLTNLYLGAKVLVNTSNTFLNNIVSNPLKILSGNSLCSKIMPKLRITLGIISLLVSTFSMGPPLQSSKDYFEGTLRDLMQFGYPASILLMMFNSMQDLADTLSEGIIAFRGSDVEKELIRLDYSLAQLNSVIEKSSPEHFASFLLKMPSDLYSQIAPELEIQEINNYLTTFEEKKNLLEKTEQN